MAGLDGVSTYTILVLACIAAAKAAVSVWSTSVTVMPILGSVSLNRASVDV